MVISKLTESEALDYALNAKNAETNNKGFSAFQIVYGTNPKVPGISNSTPASLNNEFVSIDIKAHLMRTSLARLTFLQADTDERLKRALNSRINAYSNEFYEARDLISFKEENKNKWSGPGKVIGTDGKVLTVRYGNNTRRVHVSKAVKLGRELESKGETDDEKKAKNSAQNESETTIQTEKETADSDKGTENSNHEELEATKKKTNSSEYKNDKNTESNRREISGRLTSL